MGRVIELRRNFLKRRSEFGILPGSPEARALVRCLRELESAEDLPLSGDTEANLPPSAWVHQRAVPGTVLLVVYDFSDQIVTIITLRRLGMPY
jgi:hypothetical protein